MDGRLTKRKSKRLKMENKAIGGENEMAPKSRGSREQNEDEKEESCGVGEWKVNDVVYKEGYWVMWCRAGLALS